MAPASKVVLITGSNRGIGQGLAHEVAALPEPVHLLAASRAGVPDSMLKPANPASTVEFPKLDYNDDASIRAIVKHIKDTYGHVDVLINNGGVAPEAKEGFTEDALKTTIDTNYRGPAKLTDALLPLMTAGARVVHIGSTSCQQFNPTNPEVKAALTDPKLTRAGLDRLVAQYEADAKTKDPKAGWLFEGFLPIYASSKAFLIFLTEIQARENPDIVINSVCPGLVTTDMAADVGLNGMPIKRGVRIPIRVAFGDIGGVSGKFWSGTDPRDSETMGDVNEGWMGKPLPF